MVRELYHVPMRGVDNPKYDYLVDWNARGKLLDCGNMESKFMIDCGAFVFYVHDIPFDMDKYVEYLHKYDKQITWCISVDIIPGKKGVTPTEAEIIEAENKSMENFKYLTTVVPAPEKLMPVVHYADIHKEELIKFYCEYELPNGGHIKRMCFSRDKFATTQVGDLFYRECFKYLTKYNKWNIGVHALGETSTLLKEYNFTSADSSKAVKNSIACNIGTLPALSVDTSLSFKGKIDYNNVFYRNCDYYNSKYVDENCELTTLDKAVLKQSLW